MAKRNWTTAQCRKCGRSTSHVVLKSRTHETVEVEASAWWETTHERIECSGCQCISLRETETSSEWDESQVRYFPPVGLRRKPDWGTHFLLNADMHLQELLDEVYAALSANCRRLASMGCRALLDMAMTDRVGDVGGFEQRLCALERKGVIAIEQRIF